MPVLPSSTLMNRSFCRNFLRYIWFSVSGTFVSGLRSFVSVSLSGSLVSVSLSFAFTLISTVAFHIRSCRTAYGNHCFSCCLCGYHTCITDFCDCFITGFIFPRSLLSASIFRSDHCGSVLAVSPTFSSLLSAFTETPVIGFLQPVYRLLYCNFCIYIAVSLQKL